MSVVVVNHVLNGLGAALVQRRGLWRPGGVKVLQLPSSHGRQLPVFTRGHRDLEMQPSLPLRTLSKFLTRISEPGDLSWSFLPDPVCIL